MPLVLAKRSKAEAHSRTCVMLPGELSTSEVEIVWMESMMTSSGLASLMLSKIFSNDVSHNTCTAALPPMRSARILIWWALSSPLT